MTEPDTTAQVRVGQVWSRIARHGVERSSCNVLELLPHPVGAGRVRVLEFSGPNAGEEATLPTANLRALYTLVKEAPE